MSVRVSALFFTAGLILLAAGISIYLTVRPPDTASGLSAVGVPSAVLLNLPSTWRLAGALPSFFHVAAFSCFSYACCVPLSRRFAALIAFSWSAVNVSFEIGQALKPHLPITTLSEYLKNGTFDPLDVIASCCGGLVTFFVAGRALKWRKL
jgi:hypothetical protein